MQAICSEIECPFRIPASNGCTRIAHGLKCEHGVAPTTQDEACNVIEADALRRQVDGTHYKDKGPYQPWLVLRSCLTPEEYRGYMKGTALVYLMRDGDKKGTNDIAKAEHTLEAFRALAT